jgi:mannose-6-phosphate isomerase-like protein (cupin superfamily)
MPVIGTHDAIEHRLHDSTFRSFAAPATGSRELCAWRLEVPARTAGVPHRVTKEEVFLLLDGQLTVTLDGVAATAGPGDVVLVPAGAEVKVDSGDTAATVWVTTSVGLEATMRDGTRISPPWVR